MSLHCSHFTFNFLCHSLYKFYAPKTLVHLALIAGSMIGIESFIMVNNILYKYLCYWVYPDRFHSILLSFVLETIQAMFTFFKNYKMCRVLPW